LAQSRALWEKFFATCVLEKCGPQGCHGLQPALLIESRQLG
jgi:hypothetical protein